MAYAACIPWANSDLLLPSNLSTLPANLWLDASLSSSSEDSNYPRSNLQAALNSVPLANPFRFTGCTSEWIEADHGSAKDISIVGLLNHNLTPSATVQVVVGPTTDPTVTVGGGITTSFPLIFRFSTGGVTIGYSATIPWRLYDMYVLFPSVQTYEFCRIKIQDPTNPDGFISIGKIVGGKYTQLGYGFNYAWPITDQFKNNRVSTPYNVPHVTAFSYQMAMQHQFEQLKDSEINTLRTLALQCQGDTLPLFWIPDPDIYDGYLVRMQGDFTRVMDKRRKTSISLIEESRGRAIAA